MQTDTFVVLRSKFEQAMKMMSDDQLTDLSRLALSFVTVQPAPQINMEEVPAGRSQLRPGMAITFLGRKNIKHNATIISINTKTATVLSSTDGRKWRVGFSLIKTA